MPSKDRVTRDPHEKQGVEDRFAPPEAGVTALETEQSEEKGGSLCVSPPPFPQHGCSTHEQPEALFCIRPNTVVAVSTVLYRCDTSLTGGLSRCVRNGRHRTPARIEVPWCRTARDDA